MEEIYAERVAGIDIGNRDVKVCVRVPGKRKGTFTPTTRTFATMTNSLLELRDWLIEQGVTLVGMESTGQYWRPVFYVLEGAVECWLVNPQHVKKVPGRKSDVTDAQWLARLVQFGLVRPSFVPPQPIRELRDLTRYRTQLVRERTRHVQRLHDVLEDAGIQVDQVASDIMGTSGQLMIRALIDGERDPQVLADLAVGRMRGKNAALREALVGRFNDHHAFMCRVILGEIAALNASIDELSARIDTAITPFRHQQQLLMTIPGISRRLSEVYLAEVGPDMTRFPSPADLSSWAGMCPGNNESAGKRMSTHTRPGNAWLRGALGEAAAGAARTKTTYLGERYRRLARRIGTKKAKVAIGRNILEAGYQVLTRNTPYLDLGPEHFQRIRNPERVAQRAIRQLLEAGYHVEPHPGRALTVAKA